MQDTVSKYLELEKDVTEYCNKIASAVENNHTKPKFKDYPATVVSCTSKTKFKIFHGESGKVTCKFETLLFDNLSKLGKIGASSNLTNCKYPIGNCAEPHAANKLLERTFINSLDQIVFSQAMRPRTKEIIPYCENCKAIFPTLNL